MMEPLWDEGQANCQQIEKTAGYLREEQIREAATSLKLPTTEDYQRDLQIIKGENERSGPGEKKRSKE